MDLAGTYGEAIAALVYSLEGRKILAAFARRALNEVELADLAAARDWIESIRGSQAHRDRLELALLVRELASRSDAERELAKRILSAILDFSDSSNERSYLG